MKARALALLRDTLELLADPAKWTQGATARDADGKAVPPWDEDAVSWCAGGAPFKIAGCDSPEAREAILILARALPRGRSVSGYNDDSRRTHPEVLERLRRAIALAEAER